MKKKNKLKDVHIKFIPQSEQRPFAQYGDYWETEGSIEIRITIYANPSYSQAIAIHELIEKWRNNQIGIKDSDVDQFDKDHPELNDPGWSLDAPYNRTHSEADIFERLFINLSGNNWIEYEKALDNEQVE